MTCTSAIAPNKSGATRSLATARGFCGQGLSEAVRCDTGTPRNSGELTSSKALYKERQTVEAQEVKYQSANDGGVFGEGSEVLEPSGDDAGGLARLLLMWEIGWNPPESGQEGVGWRGLGPIMGPGSWVLALGGMETGRERTWQTGDT